MQSTIAKRRKMQNLKIALEFAFHCAIVTLVPMAFFAAMVYVIGMNANGGF